MNKQVKDYIDGIVIPSDIAVKRMKTGEYVREICENIERAAKEIYGVTAIHEDDMTCIESTQIYFIPCVDNTKTTGGYFCGVYLYMEDDFMDADCYETKIQLMFGESSPEIDENYDYEIREGLESTFDITIGPNGFDVDYKPLNDPIDYPTMTGDVERITAFMKIVNESKSTIRKYEKAKLFEKDYGASVAPKPTTPTSPTIDYHVENNESPEICSECGGRCCKAYAGAYHPKDFGVPITYEFLKSLFDTSTIKDAPKVSIDWYEGYSTKYPRGYFIRPRHNNGGVIDPSWGGTCTNLTPNGCKLNWDNRPWQCKHLEPTEGFRCVGFSDPKYVVAAAWEPYYPIIEKIIEEREKEKCSTKKSSSPNSTTN